MNSKDKRNDRNSVKDSMFSEDSMFKNPPPSTSTTSNDSVSNKAASSEKAREV